MSRNTAIALVLGMVSGALGLWYARKRVKEAVGGAITGAVETGGSAIKSVIFGGWGSPYDPQKALNP